MKAITSDNGRAIAFMLMSMALFGIMNNCIRQATAEMHSGQLVLLRCIFGSALITLWILASGSRERLRTHRPRTHLLRAVIGLGATGCWFYALANMPLNDATALSFTTPVFVTLFAILFLKERPSLARWGSILLGLIGTWIILRPGDSGFEGAAIYALVSAGLLAILSILLKLMTRSEHPDTISLYNVLFMAPLALPLALWNWQPLSGEGLFWAFVVALVGSMAHLLLVRAMQLAELTLVIPFDFTRLIFTALLAYLWFGELLDEMTLLGAAVIVLASLWGVMEGNKEVRQRLRRLLSLYRD